MNTLNQTIAHHCLVLPKYALGMYTWALSEIEAINLHFLWLIWLPKYEVFTGYNFDGSRPVDVTMQRPWALLGQLFSFRHSIHSDIHSFIHEHSLTHSHACSLIHSFHCTFACGRHFLWELLSYSSHTIKTLVKTTS